MAIKDDEYKEALHKWMCDGSFHAANGTEQEWLNQGQKLLAKSVGLDPLDKSIASVMTTTLKNTTWETLGEALVETADRMQRGMHSPIDHLLLREAARRCKGVVDLATGPATVGTPI